LLLSDAVAGTETVVRLLARCSQLASLTLMCRDDAAQLLAVAARHCRLLRHLAVRFCPMLTYADLRTLGEGCPGLRSLNLEGNYGSYVFFVVVVGGGVVDVVIVKVVIAFFLMFLLLLFFAVVVIVAVVVFLLLLLLLLCCCSCCCCQRLVTGQAVRNGWKEINQSINGTGILQ
jgi:hypothetical protein